MDVVYAESKVMVNYRGKARARALCAWLRKCKTAIVEMKGVFYEVIRSFGGFGIPVWGRGVGVL